MNDASNNTTEDIKRESLGKKPLDPHLFSGPMGTVDDVRVQSGYPLWNLIDAWIAAGYNDDVLVQEYQLDPAEWTAAKQYYLDHKPILDARIIANTQPAADDDIPPMRTTDDYFAWLARAHKDKPATKAS